MKNTVAKIIQVIGLIEIVLGVLIGLLVSNEYGEMNWIVFLTWSVAGFIGGMMFVGFAEIIELLHKINSKINGTDATTVHTSDKLDENSKSGTYNSIMKDWCVRAGIIYPCYFFVLLNKWEIEIKIINILKN